jgi:4-hydroxy-4-methyl-2-oxoglutarate aldolase
VTPNSAFPSGPGEVGLPLALGEVAIDAGDLVMGDRDGVVIVPYARIPAIAERLERVATLEAEMHTRLARGEIRTLLDRWPELRDQITYVE